MKILSWVTTKIRKISHWLQAFFINNIRIHIQYTEPDLSKPLGSGSGYHTSCRYNDIKLVVIIYNQENQENSTIEINKPL